MKKMHHVLLIAALAAAMVIEAIRLPQSVQAQTSSDPVLVGAGDIVQCSGTGDEQTANLLDNISGTVFTLGDSVYPDGTPQQFTDCYNPTWGRHKARTNPAVGNHDYHTTGAAGYFGYFGQAASPLDNNCTSNCKGYYSYSLGTWHIIVLNLEIDATKGSTQEQWLRSDLSAHPNACTLAYFHEPRFSSGLHGDATSKTQGVWDALYQYHADVVLNGHDHMYERFAPQNPSGAADAQGIREFVVGTGGGKLYDWSTIQPNSQARNNTDWGVLKLTLHSGSYDWEFIPVAGKTYRDSGSANCVGGGSVATATPGTIKATPTAGTNPTPTPTGSTSDEIFSDNFETGTLARWSAKVTDSGDLRTTGAAAIRGVYGLRALIDDNNPIYVVDTQPNLEPRYRVRFYFDPNSIKMASGDAYFILNAFKGTSTAVILLEFRRYSGSYQLRARLRNDASVWSNTSWFSISDGPHAIELDWRASSGAGMNDGGLALWIDGIQKGNLAGIDNDTLRIDRVIFGATTGIDTGTRGTYYMDEFVSRRQTYIGP